MDELSTPSVIEPHSIESVESRLCEVNFSDSRPTIEAENTKIVEFIKDGLSPEQIEYRLSNNLQQPEIQRRLIDELSPYSAEINKYIRTTQELSFYMKQGLVESRINDRPCLLKEIDLDLKDGMGLTNKERMARGLAPIDENGDKVELHHIGQKKDSPLAELSQLDHDECSSILHDNSIPTEIHGEGNTWRQEREQYWKDRSQSL